MAKKVKVSGKVKGSRGPRGPSMSIGHFLSVYTPMALAGNSAKDIGVALGKPPLFVNMKATQLRKSINKSDLPDNQKKELLAKVPHLSGRGGRSSSVVRDIATFTLPQSEPS